VIRLASSALALFLSCSLATAATFAIPIKRPIVTVDIPDSWGPKARTSGVEAKSDDDEIHVVLEVVTAADVNSAVQEGVDLLLKGGVRIDTESAEVQQVKIGDLDASAVRFAGKYKDRAANMSLTLLATNAAGKFLLLYYWGSPEGEQDNKDSLQAIADSIQVQAAK
jgi:hypothetical protein